MVSCHIIKLWTKTQSLSYYDLIMQKRFWNKRLLKVNICMIGKLFFVVSYNKEAQCIHI